MDQNTKLLCIEKWSLFTNYYLVSQGEKSLWGEIPWYLKGQVFGHSTIKDETIIMSSKLISLDLQQKRAKTQNSIYVLGEADPSW